MTRGPLHGYGHFENDHLRKAAPRLASMLAFLRSMVAHLLWPNTERPLGDASNRGKPERYVGEGRRINGGAGGPRAAQAPPP